MDLTHEVRLIAAVGRSGQIGLKGRLPWHDAEDLEWFKQCTMGHAVIVGGRTAAQLPKLPGRMLVVWNGCHDTGHFLGDVSRAFATWRESAGHTTPGIIYIAGGSYTYSSFMRHVRRFVVTSIDYDGQADTFLPALWRVNDVHWKAIATNHARVVDSMTAQCMELTRQRDELLRRVPGQA